MKPASDIINTTNPTTRSGVWRKLSQVVLLLAIHSPPPIIGIDANRVNRFKKPINVLLNRGYIEAIREIEQQVQASGGTLKFDDIVVACGSGGTIAGLSLGSWLGNLKAKVHAFSVCDDPDYFHSFVEGLTDGLTARVNSYDIVNIQNAKGLGYAMNTSDELQFVKEVAISTGIVLDPVYSGKAAYGMMKDMAENPKKWEGRKILFIHTGGLLGLYDKVEQLSPLVGNWSRMHLDESVPRNHGIGKMF